MKKLVFFIVLAVSVCLAGNAVTLGSEPSSEDNAHWRIIPGVHAGAGCVLDDRDVYGTNDDAFLSYSGIPIDLSGYDGVKVFILYKQVTADNGSNDCCKLYLADGVRPYVLVHTFKDTDDWRYEDIMLDDFGGTRDLKIVFEWVSDDSGVDMGFRVADIEIYGVNWDQGEYENIFTWDTTSDVIGHQTINVADYLTRGNMNCLSFKYHSGASSQGWWTVDNVELTVNGESVMPRRGGGYGVEDFESGGWYQYQYQGLPGEWETDTDHATGIMYGANWQCDAAAHPGWRYDVETFSPWVTIHGVNTAIVDFDTWFNPMRTGDSAKFGCYSSTSHENLVFLDLFDDLGNWDVSDYGGAVTETSWGAIKASF